jgi:hypothetical protein
MSIPILLWGLKSITMKIFKSFLMGLFLVVSISACNKDIPKYIPEWLKVKIKEIKKDLKHKDGVGEGIYFDQITNDTVILYQYHTGGVMVSMGTEYYLYSEDGDLICSTFALLDCNETYTFENIKNNFYKVRRIWTAK